MSGPSVLRNEIAGREALQALLQVELDPGGRLVAVLRVLGEQFQDDGIDHRGDSRRDGRRRDRHPGNVVMDDFQRVVTHEWQVPRHDFVENHPERIQVRTFVDLAVDSSGLLRRHVG